MSLITNSAGTYDIFVGKRRDSSGDDIDSGLWQRTYFHPATAVVEVVGEIDAANADELASAVGGIAAAGRPFILDLSRVEFLGVPGYRRLADINEQCARSNTPWALVTSQAVDALLRLAEGASEFPAVATLADALKRLASVDSAPALQTVVCANASRC